ncbi:MAG: glycosyltransferase [Candidatus Saccharimonadales bacterium]
MKILIASDLHWPTINGVATFSRNLAQGLSARGHEVIVIAPSQTGKKYKEVDGNYTIARTAAIPFPFYQNFMISLSPNGEVRKIIKSFKPDVIHIQMPLMIGQAVMKYGTRHNIPIVTTSHAMPENLMDNLRLVGRVAKPINYMIKMFGARFHSKADYITMPTKAAMGMFGSMVDKVDVPIEAVSNGIDLSRFSNTKPSKDILKKFDIPTDDPIVTYIGRLDAEKHLPVLVRAFDRVLKNNKAHLLMVGSGTDNDNLRILAYELGISDHITFAGRVSDEDLVELHKVGTLYCITSPVELQSIATLEAMASGKPIVAVDTGALWELCQNERNGFLCRTDDDKQIAESITKIIINPTLRESMSRESLAIAGTHDLKVTITRFEEIYSDLIKKRIS